MESSEEPRGETGSEGSPWLVTSNVKVTSPHLASQYFSHVVCFTGGVLATPGPSDQGKTSPRLHQISAQPLGSRPYGGGEERNAGHGVPKVNNCSSSLTSFHERLFKLKYKRFPFFLAQCFSGGFQPSKIDAESKWTETVGKVFSPAAQNTGENKKPKQVLKEVDSILTISASSSRSSYKMPPGTSRTRKCQENYVRETGAK